MTDGDAPAIRIAEVERERGPLLDRHACLREARLEARSLTGRDCERDELLRLSGELGLARIATLEHQDSGTQREPDARLGVSAGSPRVELKPEDTAVERGETRDVEGSEGEVVNTHEAMVSRSS